MTTMSFEQDFASEKCLKAYYDQLPTETAPFSVDAYTADDNLPTYGHNIDAEPSQQFPDFGFSAQNTQEPVVQAQPDLLSHSDILHPEPAIVEEIREADFAEDQTQDEMEMELENEPEMKPLPQDSINTEEPQTESKEPPSEEPLKQEDPVKDFVDEVEKSPPTPEACSKSTDLSSLLTLSVGGVKDLLYWKDVKVSGVVFGLLLLVLLSLNCFSVVSVVAYFTLSMLAVTITFRLYKLVLQTLNGTQQPNPFQSLLDMEIALSSEQVHKYTDAALDHVNCTLVSTRDLLLVKNTVASLKFGVFMWLLTYIGCCFNGLTILILGVVAAFSIPPVYQKYQVPIDNHYNMAAQKVAQATNTIRSKIPGAKPKTQ
uniref:Reticulon-like protein n=1 Tax=Ciona savignyi TaxID=51511 RepID=H2Z0Y3_CIOSA